MKTTFKLRFFAMMLTMMLVISGFHTVVVAYAEEPNGTVSELASAKNLDSQGYDVICLIDNSRSMWKQQDIRNQAFRKIANMAVGSDIRIGGVYFADHAYDILSLTSMNEDDGRSDVLKFLKSNATDEENIDTNIGNALKEAVKLFDSQDSSRKRIVILFSDGINENLAQDASYTQSANKETEKQAKILESMGIPIYCVYLEKGRNDETYLHNLVNYFSDKNSYVEERFAKVKESEIDTLSDTFVDVFYTMQNDMKFYKVEPDSLGNVHFFVPSLGIEKLHIYLDGIVNVGKIKGDLGEKAEEIQDGPTWFTVYENPNRGDFSFKVSSSDNSQVTGSIVYHANLKAKTELLVVSDAKSDLTKEYQLNVRFFDKEDNQIDLEPKAVVKTAVELIREDGTTFREPLTMTIEDGIAKSEIFSMDDYGNYNYDIQLTYENFIDLQYEISGGTIAKTPIVVHSIKNGKFQGEKTEDGIVFSIKENELFEDLEGEEITLQNVVQLNASNNVKIERENGYIKVTALKAGDVDFSLQLSDTSGMTAEVNLQGQVIDKGVKRTMEFIIIIVIGLFVMAVLLKKTKNKRDGETLQKLIEKFEQAYNKVDDSKCKTLLEELGEKKILCAVPVFGKDGVEGILGMAQKLTEAQKKDFDIVSITDTFLENYFSPIITTAEKNINDVAENVLECYQDVEDIRKLYEQNKASAVSKENIEKVKTAISTVEKLSETLDGMQVDLKTKVQEAEQLFKNLAKKATEIKRMLETPFKFNFTVTGIDGVAGAKGTVQAVGLLGDRRVGYYKLDDINIVGFGAPLSAVMGGTTDIYVYAYTGTDVSGVKLRGLTEFTCNGKTVQEVVLSVGMPYVLTVNVAGWMRTIDIHIG